MSTCGRTPVFLVVAAASVLLPQFASAARAEQIELSGLNLSAVIQDYGDPHRDRSVDGHRLSIGGKVFDHGLGTHAAATWTIDLHGSAKRLTALAGVDDEVGRVRKPGGAATVIFVLVGDGNGQHPLLKTYPIHAGETAVPLDVNLSGLKTLTIRINPGGTSIDSDHADLANGVIEFDGQKPQSLIPPAEPAEPSEILTPPAPATPRINGPTVVGVRPGHPLLYSIPATGERPMQFTASGLPAGLSLAADTGQISGIVNTPGRLVLHLTAENPRGVARKDVTLVVGDRVALTPPMGWNSWNCFAGAVTQDKVQSAADAMVASGLANHGWAYINVDDCWEVRAGEPAEGRRFADGRIRTNARFSDMHAMAAYIHAKGLRAGLYSSPGPATCGGFTASYGHELQDASSYAAWGFDYLKYDWCSYSKIAKTIAGGPNPPTSLQIDQQPYFVMRDALAKQNRDIVFSLCQYGMGDVWTWGDRVGGNCWRTTGDIRDTWKSMSTIGFAQGPYSPYADPGHWNDPDMLVVGKVGWGPSLHPTRLTPSEQYTHITLWSMLAAPLLIGCDMTQIDPFTLGLLTNDEVLAVDQDALGRAATPAHRDGTTEVWTRDLADGTKAVALFDRGDAPAEVTASWADLHLTGRQPVRDLWRQKDLPTANGSFAATVPRHGTLLLKIGRPTN